MGNFLPSPLKPSPILYRVECTLKFETLKTMDIELTLICTEGTIGPMRIFGLASEQTYVQEHFVADIGHAQYVEISVRQNKTHAVTNFTVPSIDVLEWRKESTNKTFFSVDGELKLNDLHGISAMFEPKSRTLVDVRHTYNGSQAPAEVAAAMQEV